jgi:predicted Zn-dependent peptidase
VGDISPEQALAAVQASFGGWRGAPREKIAVGDDSLVTRAGQTTVKEPLPDKSNVDVFVGHPVKVAVSSPDYFPAVVGNAALGYDAFTCRLAPVRDRFGLTYSIASSLTGEFPESPWNIEFSVNPENYAKAVTLVQKITRDYEKSGISAKELKEETSQLEGAYFVAMRGPKQIASKLCQLEALGLGAKFIDNFGDNLRRVTAQQVNECIRKYFSLDRSVITAAGTWRQGKPSSAK